MTARRMEDFIGLIIVLMAIGIVLSMINRPPSNGREISIAARACWDQGLRAILHRDGTIECRD